MRVGVFGGSFDPVHHGHLQVARRVADQLHLDQVRFIPAALQPLKQGGPVASAADRVTMLRLAVAGHPDFVVDERELQRPGPSYTVDTLRSLRAENPANRLFLIVGSDAARDLPRWREAGVVAELATIVIVPRPGSAPVEAPPGAMVLDLPPRDESATGVRRAAAAGGPVPDVPPAVAEYMASHGLYRTGV